MNTLLFFALVSVAQCSPLLKDLPANADVSYEYDGNKLEGIKIDYNDDKVVYTAPAAPAPVAAAPAPAAPAPAKPVVIAYSAPAAAPAPAAPASIPTYYEVDD